MNAEQVMVNQAVDISNSLKDIAAQNHHFYDTPLFAALVGATFGVLPFLYQMWKDRPIIQVKIDTVFVASSIMVEKGISITIYNHGRRPVVLKNVFLKFDDDSALLFIANSNFVGLSSGLPMSLNEGNSHSVTILAGTIAMDFLKKQTYPTHACYSDALGNEYKCKTTKDFWDDLFRKK